MNCLTIFHWFHKYLVIINLSLRNIVVVDNFDIILQILLVLG